MYSLQFIPVCFWAYYGFKQLVCSRIGFYMWRRIFLLLVDEVGIEVPNSERFLTFPAASFVVDW